MGLFPGWLLDSSGCIVSSAIMLVLEMRIGSNMTDM